MSAGDSGCICIIPLAEDNAAIENITISQNYTQVTDKVNIGCPGILTPAVNYVLCLAGLQLAIRKV